MNKQTDTDDQDLTEIRRICSRFPEAEEDELQDRPLFHVHRRRFAIFNGSNAPYRRRWDGFGRSLHFMTAPHRKTEFEEDVRFFVSPHHGFRGWWAFDLQAGIVEWPDIDELLESAYRCVAGKELVAELDRSR